MSAISLNPVLSDRRRLHLSLVVVATAQLMLVLDGTIANIALPSIQKEFGVPAALLPWIISAYVLAFGSLLLFGGRVGDLYGRRRVLRIGLSIFTLASLSGGLGQTTAMLIASRGLQGMGAALIAPNVLALIATTFPVGKERNAAMAVYAAMSAVGMTVGILLGGMLTGLFSWRWVFLINVPIGLAVLVGTRILGEPKGSGGSLHAFDAICGSAAVFALAYGITRGGEHGWNDVITLGLFVAFAMLGMIFLVLQRHRRHPMLPLNLFSDCNRSGSYLAVLFIGGGLMATYYLLTLFMQQVLQFTPAMAGLASLPVSVGIVLAAGVSTKLVERFAPRVVAVPGLLIAAVGMYLLSLLSPDSSYFSHVLPALFVTYFGLGMGFLPLTLTAVQGVYNEQTGAASAMLNASQQIGAALGVSVLGTISTLVSVRLLPQASNVLQQGLAAGEQSRASAASSALTQGYTAAFLTGAASMLIAAAIVAVWVNTRQRQRAPATIV